MVHLSSKSHGLFADPRENTAAQGHEAQSSAQGAGHFAGGISQGWDSTGMRWKSQMLRVKLFPPFSFIKKDVRQQKQLFFSQNKQREIRGSWREKTETGVETFTVHQQTHIRHQGGKRARKRNGKHFPSHLQSFCLGTAQINLSKVGGMSEKSQLLCCEHMQPDNTVHIKNSYSQCNFPKTPRLATILWSTKGSVITN